jgi:hypothetical protein
MKDTCTSPISLVASSCKSDDETEDDEVED